MSRVNYNSSLNASGWRRLGQFEDDGYGLITDPTTSGIIYGTSPSTGDIYDPVTGSYSSSIPLSDQPYAGYGGSGVASGSVPYANAAPYSGDYPSPTGLSTPPPTSTSGTSAAAAAPTPSQGMNIGSAIASLFSPSTNTVRITSGSCPAGFTLTAPGTCTQGSGSTWTQYLPLILIVGVAAILMGRK